jgi:DNA-binding transcriptional ArsR family regulator
MPREFSDLDEKLAAAVHELRALAHPIRLDIVISLESYDMSVNTLVYKHLAILLEAEIVTMRKVGKSHVYGLKNADRAKQIIQLVADQL